MLKIILFALFPIFLIGCSEEDASSFGQNVTATAIDESLFNSKNKAARLAGKGGVAGAIVGFSERLDANEKRRSKEAAINAGVSAVVRESRIEREISILCIEAASLVPNVSAKVLIGYRWGLLKKNPSKDTVRFAKIISEISRLNTSLAKSNSFEFDEIAKIRNFTQSLNFLENIQKQNFLTAKTDSDRYFYVENTRKLYSSILQKCPN